MSYNGWKNYETWNVILWIGNDEGLYFAARVLGNYTDLLKVLKRNSTETPDGVKWDSPDLDVEAINQFIGEL